MFNKIFIPAILMLLLSACNLEKTVQIELPEYNSQPVVEFYLEPGKPTRLLLTKSFSFFAPFDTSFNQFLQNIVIDSALVTLTHNGRTDTIPNQYSFDFVDSKLFNYFSPKIIENKPGDKYELKIILKNGQTIEGRTTMLSTAKIDSIVTEFSPVKDSLARVLTYITDNPNEVNYYRRILKYGSGRDTLPEQDFLVDDKLNTTNIIAFGTGYNMKEGDTVYNSIYHISRDYYDYILSYQLAVQGNVNPFAQPSQIKSNLTGTANPLGIFTAYQVDRVLTVIKK